MTTNGGTVILLICEENFIHVSPNYSFIFVLLTCTRQRTINGYLGKPLKWTEACGLQTTAVRAVSQTEAHTVNASTMSAISVGERPALLALGCIWLPIFTCFYSPYIMHITHTNYDMTDFNTSKSGNAGQVDREWQRNKERFYREHLHNQRDQTKSGFSLPACILYALPCQHAAFYV